MPLRACICAAGHSSERLVRGVPESSYSCPQCGADAVLSPINPIAVGYRGKWGSEFQMPHDMRDAHDQAMGYKEEAIEAQAEAVQNGFQL